MTRFAPYARPLPLPAARLGSWLPGYLAHGRDLGVQLPVHQGGRARAAPALRRRSAGPPPARSPLLILVAVSGSGCRATRRSGATSSCSARSAWPSRSPSSATASSGSPSILAGIWNGTTPLFVLPDRGAGLPYRAHDPAPGGRPGPRVRRGAGGPRRVARRRRGQPDRAAHVRRRGHLLRLCLPVPAQVPDPAGPSPASAMVSRPAADGGAAARRGRAAPSPVPPPRPQLACPGGRAGVLALGALGTRHRVRASTSASSASPAPPRRPRSPTWCRSPRRSSASWCCTRS